MNYVEISVDAEEVLDQVSDKELLDYIKTRDISEEMGREALISALLEREKISLFDAEKMNYFIDNISDISLNQLEKATNERV